MIFGLKQFFVEKGLSKTGIPVEFIEKKRLDERTPAEL